MLPPLHTRFARAGIVFVLGAALFSLGTWMAGAWHIATFGADYVPMAPITALLLLLLGASHGACLRWPDSHVGFLARALIAAVTTVVSFAVLLSAGTALPWEDWLLPTEDRGRPVPLGRMAPLTAALFLLAVTALVGRCSVRLLPGRLGAAAAAAGLVIAITATVGYLAGLPNLYAGQDTPIALLTAVAFIALHGSLLLGGRSNPSAATAGAGMDDALPKEAGVLKRRLTVGALTLAVGMGIGGYFHIRSAQAEARAAILGQLDAVAELKAAEIGHWRTERLTEGQFLTHARFVAEDMAGLVAAPESPEAQARVLDWLNLIKGGDRYETVTVFDSAGRSLLAIPEGGLSVDHHAQHADSIRNRPTPFLTDLHVGEDGSAIHLNLVVPIFAPGGRSDSAAIGIIVLQLDPGKSLFPMIQSWPTPSPTAETLLVRREGDEVLFLNPLRHRSGTALNLRRSIHDTALLAARAVRGQLGAQEVADYRGVAVMGVARVIPDTSWVLIAKVDLAELYAPVRRQAWENAALLAFLLGGIWVSATVIWRNRQTDFLRQSLTAERERKLLADRLAFVTRHANDIILLLDPAGRILEANERATAEYGYTLDELRRLPPGALRPASEKEALSRQMDGYDRPEGILFETIHQRRDGTRFPVEINGRALELESARVRLAIVRDITQRREHERQIERLTRLYEALSGVNQAIVRSPTRAGLIQEFCRVLVSAGRFRIAWIGWQNPATGMIQLEASAGDDSGYLEGLQVSVLDRPDGRGPTGTSIRESRTEVCNDFMADSRTLPWRERATRAGIKSSISLPVPSAGQAVGALTVYSAEAGCFGPGEIKLLEEVAEDLSFALEALKRDAQRREAEESLHASETQFRALFENSYDGMAFTSLDGRIFKVNPAACRMLRRTEAEICALGRNGIMDLSDPRLAQFLEARRQNGYAAGGVRFVRPDGSTVEAEIASTVFEMPEGQRSCLALRDITDRQKAEARLAAQLDELRRWHAVTLGRESRVLELKREVNDLLTRAGVPPRYASAGAADDGPVQPGSSKS